MLVGSKELKKAVVQRIDNNQVNIYRLCEKSGANYARFQTWMNDADPRHKSTSTISQEHLIAVCGTLGIEPRLLIVLKKGYEADPYIKNKLF